MNPTANVPSVSVVESAVLPTGKKHERDDLREVAVDQEIEPFQPIADHRSQHGAANLRLAERRQ